MPRDFQINGETLVRVRFGEHLADGIGGGIIDGALFPSTAPVAGPNGTVYELGLALNNVRIVPQFYHKDVRCDDFGPNVPAEIIAMLAWVNVNMALIHYDVNVVEECLAESLGGNVAGLLTGVQMPGAGAALGHGLPLGASGNHHVSLSLLSEQLLFPWRFPACHMTGPPVQYPIGTQASVVICNFRAIPYTFPGQGVSALGATSGTGLGKEVISSGRILWDHSPDPP